MADASGPRCNEFAELAAAYPARLSRQHGKQHGVWFTPLELALPTAERVLAPLLVRSPLHRLRVVDPAVGGGTFLLAAHRLLSRHGFTPVDAARCLFGLDVDAEVARLAEQAIRQECGLDASQLPVTGDLRNGNPAGPATSDAPLAQIRGGDGLLELEPGTFDAVLTNPPWETLQSGPEAHARIAALRPHFHHQGRGKLQTYRLFVERAFQLLRPGGRMGLIVPASLWFDRDAEALRQLLLDRCDWQWLFGFENRKQVFAIDRRYRFGALIAEKGGTTRVVRVAFGRTDLAEWAQPEPPHTCYSRSELRESSPHSGAFVEVHDRRDLDILRRMHARACSLIGPGGALVWRQGDFNMTADKHKFVLRIDAEESGYRRDPDAVWRRRGAPDLLPLYQGAMIYDLHPNAAAHAGGVGHATEWRDAEADELRPVYLVAEGPWRASAPGRCAARIALRALSNATNERTVIACLLPDVPCGNSLGVLEPQPGSPKPLRQLAAGAAVLSSLSFDWALRLRLGGTNLNGFVLADCAWPRLDSCTASELAVTALALCAILPWHAALWRAAHAEGWGQRAAPALDGAQRAQLATRIDTLVGASFGLTRDDVAWIARGCDLPAAELRRFRPPPDLAKGLWRIDRTLPPARRRPNRWLAAIAD